MTLVQMATAVRNNTMGGMDGVDVLAFSLEQLQDELILTASSVIIRLSEQGTLDLKRLHQRIDGIRVACKDISSNCDVPTNVAPPHFTIPNINRFADTPISYLGSMDGILDFKIYFDREYRFHKFRLATGKGPFAWVSTTANSDGTYDVFLFNMGKYNNLKFISIEMLLDNPYDLLNTDYYEQFSNAEFYAPLIVQQEAIDMLTKKYVNYYRQLKMHQKPNVQQL